MPSIQLLLKSLNYPERLLSGFGLGGGTCACAVVEAGFRQHRPAIRQHEYNSVSPLQVYPPDRSRGTVPPAAARCRDGHSCA